MSAQLDDCRTKLYIPEEVLDDLSCRFIINVPSPEKQDLVRAFFQVEQAHWFYLDFYVKESPSLFKSCNITEFSRLVFNHIPYLRPFLHQLDTIIADWKMYKKSVPTFGAIILDETLEYILLVKSFLSRSSWGFPKGKINKDESPFHCAIREVYEEIGYDVSNEINPNVFIEGVISNQVVRLYIVHGVTKATRFQPLTRNEIKYISWFHIDSIPIGKTNTKNKIYHSFFNVVPFMRDIRRWILQNSAMKNKISFRRSFRSFSEIEHLILSESLGIRTCDENVNQERSGSLEESNVSGQTIPFNNCAVLEDMENHTEDISISPGPPNSQTANSGNEAISLRGGMSNCYCREAFRRSLSVNTSLCHPLNDRSAPLENVYVSDLSMNLNQTSQLLMACNNSSESLNARELSRLNQENIPTLISNDTENRFNNVSSSMWKEVEKKKYIKKRIIRQLQNSPAVLSLKAFKFNWDELLKCFDD